MTSPPAQSAVSAGEGDPATISKAGIGIVPKQARLSPADDDAVTDTRGPAATELKNPRAFCLSPNGDPKNMIVVREVNIPSSSCGLGSVADENNVLIRVEAATISRTDCELRRGLFPHGSISRSHALGCEVVGIIVRVSGEPSSSETVFRIGDRVCAIGLGLGGNSRFLSLPRSSLIAVPPDLDPIMVACLPRTYVTAFQCLHRMGRPIKNGDAVLVTGGSGLVGQAVVELACAARASVVYITGADSNTTETKTCANARMEVIKLESRDPSEWLPIIQGKVDLAIDLVCSPDGSYGHTCKTLKADGTGLLVCVGAMSYLPLSTSSSDNAADVTSPLLSSVLANMANFKAETFLDRTVSYDLFEECSPEKPRRRQYEEDLQTLFRLLRDGRISPSVAQCVPLADVPSVHSRIETGKGKSGHFVCLPCGFDTAEPSIECLADERLDKASSRPKKQEGERMSADNEGGMEQGSNETKVVTIVATQSCIEMEQGSNEAKAMAEAATQSSIKVEQDSNEAKAPAVAAKQSGIDGVEGTKQRRSSHWRKGKGKTTGNTSEKTNQSDAQERTEKKGKKNTTNRATRQNSEVLGSGQKVLYIEGTTTEAAKARHRTVLKKGLRGVSAKKSS